MSKLKHVLLALCVASACLVAYAPATEAASKPEPPSISIARPIKGEVFSISGDIGTKKARTIVLERLTGGKWIDLLTRRTTSQGRYAFAYSAKVDTASYRIRAPKSGNSAARVSHTRLIRAVTDKVTLTTSHDAGQLKASAQFVAARPGRPLALQVETAPSQWSTLDTERQGAGGLASISATVELGVPANYRIQVPAWQGAASHVSPVVTFTVPEPDPPPDALPTLSITTVDAAPIASKETYVVAGLELGGVTHALGIRGRGNSTWERAKKPYRIKLDKKASLLGMPADKDWALLANFYDRSLLRNFLAFSIGHETVLAWTPHAKHVNLTLNGVDQGNYLLVEHVEPAVDRVQVAEGGMLMEVDHRADFTVDQGFLTSTGLPIVIKDPEDASAAEFAAVTGFVNAAETALFDPQSSEQPWSAYFDMPSLIDWYLVGELFKNADQNFDHSVFMTWDPAGKLTMGPLWDFDLSAGSAILKYDGLASPEGWHLRAEKTLHTDPTWSSAMFKDPAFEAAVADRWQELEPMIRQKIAGIPDISIEASARRDWAMWSAVELDARANTIHGNSWRQERTYLSTWLTARADWMNEQLG